MSAIQCMSCPAIYNPQYIDKQHFNIGARVAGWIVWEGPTEGGKHVKRIHCPACLGKAKPVEPSWDAVCQLP